MGLEKSVEKRDVIPLVLKGVNFVGDSMYQRLDNGKTFNNGVRVLDQTIEVPYSPNVTKMKLESDEVNGLLYSLEEIKEAEIGKPSYPNLCIIDKKILET